MPEEHTRELMAKHFPVCPICMFKADYAVSPSKVIVQCNSCKAKFRSEDFRDPQKDLTNLILFTLPTAHVDESLMPALESMKDKAYPISFWQNMKPDRTRLEKNLTEYSHKEQQAMLGLHSDVLVVTTPTIAGHRIVRVIGPIYGMTVRARGVGGHILAGIEGIFGGEITSYVEELEKARSESLLRLMDKARKIGANAVLSLNFEVSNISIPARDVNLSAILFGAYGTAVVAQPLEQSEAT